jgi:hypothetical protein
LHSQLCPVEMRPFHQTLERCEFGSSALPLREFVS